MAKRIADELDVRPRPLFVLADARALPFKDSTFDGVFSYSVIQHFSKANARTILHEVSRVLRTDGSALIQMPNSRALRSQMVLARRGFSDGAEFDVRYYSIPELLQLFTDTIGESNWSVDCFLGLNVHRDAFDLVRFPSKCIIATAELLRLTALALPPLRRLADSVYIHSRKREIESVAS
jgi:SAM-dependent methyltransferase